MKKVGLESLGAVHTHTHTHGLLKNKKEIDNSKDSNKSLLSRLLLLSFCGLNKENKRGITLIALVITITVLIILASVATYSGVGVIRQAKLNSYTTEMKIMQSEVNALYDRYTSGETEVLNLGKDLDSQADKIFTSNASGITDKTGYRYYDQETIKGLGIEGVESEYFVNVEKRSVVSYDGFEYNGVTYYTLGEVPNGEYNVEYEKNTNKPTFEVSIKAQEDGTYRMTISNIQYDGYINKWQVQYKKEGQDYWSTSEDLSFIVPEKGEYNVRLVNGEIESDIVKYAPTLVKKWATKVDGNGKEEFLDVEKTSDGGYVAVGYTTSTDISGLTNKGGEDAIIVKYDSNGNEQWKKSVGGSRNDRYSGVIEITNGTYIAVGTIYSTDVLDKNGNNIGHGYDWSAQVGDYHGSCTASEGIIARYDSNGNEISLKTTGKASTAGEDGSTNIVILGIDKVSNNNYIITGKRNMGYLDLGTFMFNTEGHLAIKYNQNGEEMATTETLSFDATYGYVSQHYRSWESAIEKEDGSYVLVGTGTSSAGGSSGLWKVDANLKNAQQFGIANSVVRDCFVDDSGNYVLLRYSTMDYFTGIEKLDSSGKEVWLKSDITMKSISKSSSTEFVGISEDNRFLKYNIDDGSIVEEYSIPAYESVYAIEGEEEFMLLGSPTNEEGVSITGSSGAVIAKYAIE